MSSKSDLAKKFYKSDYGKSYTDRHDVPLELRDKHTISETGFTITEVFKELLSHTEGVKNILEVGCGLGHNLALMDNLGDFNLTGIDIQSYATEKGKNLYNNINFMNGDLLDLPFEDNSFDLVFSRMVLIHVHPEDLNQAIKEIRRVTKKYIAGIEYFSDKVEEIEWRGQKNVVWKMDYCRHFLEIPDLCIHVNKKIPIKKEKYNKSGLAFQHYLISKI